MKLNLPAQTEFQARCADDGEFRLAARHWSGGARFRIGEQTLSLRLRDGELIDGEPGESAIEYVGPAPVWARVLSAVPERFHNDLMANLSTGGGIERHGDPVVHAQYYAAVMRAVELLRPVESASSPSIVPRDGSGPFDSPVGRYVHLNLEGVDHRIYFEEAGQGIPLLLQHTAGCHGSQWRHLFEVPEILERFRLIAYDLPFHGKSIPPEGRSWWSQPYRLEGEFLRSIPIELSRALKLDRPVFMGCSVGGLLALDLAHRHADLFRAVISVEGALKIEGDPERLQELWHPQVSGEYKARLMEGLMSPSSPLPLRKETSWVYAGGWPPVFLGDLHYYLRDFDLREVAGEIDTSRVGVHILSGEYDFSGTSELGRAAHEAIGGWTWAEMKGVGHFPMSENPGAFLRYLKPVLARVQAA